MEYIAELELEANRVPPRKLLTEMAAREGMEFRFSPPAPVSVETFRAFVMGARGLSLTDDTFLGTPEYRAVISDAIRSGRNCLVQLGLIHEHEQTSLPDFARAFG